MMAKKQVAAKEGAMEDKQQCWHIKKKGSPLWESLYIIIREYSIASNPLLLCSSEPWHPHHTCRRAGNQAGSNELHWGSPF